MLRPIDYTVDPYIPLAAPFTFPPTLKQGLYRLSFKEYLKIKLPHSSFWKAFSETPSHGLAYLEQSGGPISPIQKSAFDFGTAVHTALLEPSKFDGQVVVASTLNKNSNAYKEWKAAIPNEKLILDQTKIDDINRIRDRVYKKTFVRELLEAKGHVELTGIFEDQSYPGIYHRIRVDKALEEGILMDIKTTASASPAGFDRAIWNYKYNWQGALYLTGMSVLTGYNHNKFVWLVIEKEPPFECRLVGATAQDLTEAKDRLDVLVDKLTKCIKDNRWPGYPEQKGWDQVFNSETWDHETYEDIDSLPW